MKARKKAATAEQTQLTFEQAIERLERIVEEMEAGELPLEQILKKYEEGTQLVRFCGQKLDVAEKKIELLTKRNDGSARLEPYDTGQPAAETAEEESSDDEGKLF